MMSSVFHSQIQVAFYLKNRIAVIPGDRPLKALAESPTATKLSRPGEMDGEIPIIYDIWMVKSNSRPTINPSILIHNQRFVLWFVTCFNHIMDP